MNNLWVWIGFNLFVLLMLALDLGVFHRKSHVVKVKEAIIWTCVWITLALIFNVILYFWLGPTPALEFFTGYLIEKSLSVDNIFVFLLIFTMFRVPAEFQHKVLFWGVLGALIMRAIFIALGVALIQRFHWIIFVFGAFLIYTGIKMLFHKDEEIHPEKNIFIRLFKKFFPITHEYHRDHFFTMQNGKKFATPLFVVLIMIETTDLIFAVDSIPAILAITPDPFIVYTSNIFAIMGLRSLYFALGGLITKFYYLHHALSAILIFVGTKMLLADIYHIPIVLSLSVIAAILTLAVTASLMRAKKVEKQTLNQE